LMKVEARIAPGTTHSFIPFLCNHLIHRLPIAVSALARSDLRRVPDVRDMVLDTPSRSKRALKLVWCFRCLCVCVDDEALYAEAGDAAREDTGDMEPERSQCWLAELSMRCRRGVGAIISCLSGEGLTRWIETKESVA